MATTPIKLKRSHTISVIPDTSDLVAGEVALNSVDRKFYVRDDSNNVVTLANHYATDFDTNVISFLLNLTDNIYHKNNDGQSALTIAVSNNSNDVVKFLYFTPFFISRFITF